MLYVATSEHRRAGQVLTVRGELVNPWTAKLMAAWDRARSCAGEICWIDLSGVSMLDRDGEAVIRRIASDGARFCVGGSITSAIISLVWSEQRRCLENGRRDFRSIVSCAEWWS